MGAKPCALIAPTQGTIVYTELLKPQETQI
jgi:hypothetical protein